MLLVGKLPVIWLDVTAEPPQKRDCVASTVTVVRPEILKVLPFGGAMT